MSADPGERLRLMGLACQAYARGELDQTRQLCQACLAVDANDLDALHLIGHTFVRERRFADAVPLFSRIVAAHPSSAEALGSLGAALLASGQLREAIEVLSRAAEQDPTRAPLRYNLGLGHRLSGNYEAAIAAQTGAVACDRLFAPARNELGALLQKRGRVGEALQCFDEALSINVNDAEAHCNRGVALIGLRRFDEAAAAFTTSLHLGNETARVHQHLALSYYRLGRLEDARAHCHRALALDEQCSDAWFNLGNIVQDLGDVPAAVQHYSRALAIDAANHLARIRLAHAHLLCGDFARGWPLLHEALHVPGTAPLWDGQMPLSQGQKLVLCTEQGFGDSIQFVRFGMALAAAGHRPILQCHPRLCRLFSSAQGFAEIVPQGRPYPPGEYRWFPLMSLPAVLGTELHSIPPAPYLSADPDRVEAWRARLDGSRYSIGIAWQGSVDHEREGMHWRSIPLERFGDLMDIPGTDWVSLQKGDGSEQLERVAWRERVRSFGVELDGGADAFVDTAALIMSLDLVITSDTSVAHLAGALGRPVWVALNRTPDWRWLLDRTDSPWYPTMRLFRQQHWGDWSGVFADMRVKLMELLARSAPGWR